MKIGQLLCMVDEVQPNAGTKRIKTAYINDLEGDIQALMMERAPDEFVGHVAESHWNGAGIFFPDEHTAVIPGRAELREGGKAEFIGLGDYGENNGEYSVVSVVYEENETHVTVAESFAQTGEEPESEEANVEYDGGGELLTAPDMFRQMYVSYLHARICLDAGEFTKAANWQAEFRTQWDEFRAWFCQRYIDGGMTPWQ